MRNPLDVLDEIVNGLFPRAGEPRQAPAEPVEDEIGGSQEDIGCTVESEHRGTLGKIRASIKDNKIGMTDEEIFRSIARDHLEELPDYYTRLKKMEAD